MKKYLFTGGAVFLLVANTGAQNNVGLGISAPAASAALEIKASDKGMLVPRTCNDIQS